MKTVNSISGGKTSAYLAAHYPADYNVFALVRIEDKNCAPKDPILKKEAEARTGQPFVATAEEDETMYAVLDLEQYIGQKIHWVTGPTFEQVIDKRGGYLPNKVARYCTTELKIEPIFNWWQDNIGEAVEQRIGYRANEDMRVQSKINQVNDIGLIEHKTIIGEWESGPHAGKNKWGLVAWFKPSFPLYDDRVFKWQIENYWEGKPVRFAHMNNCTGCWWRSPVLLRKQFDRHPEKMEWFVAQEETRAGTWRSDVSYQSIKEMHLQLELDVFAEVFGADIESCDSGYCGL